jgi:hypothetical protein
MNKEFIPYEQALEFKALGFNEECSAYYFVYQDKLRFSYAGIEFDFDSGNDYIDLVNYSDYTSKEYAIAPTYRQAFRWFREKYNFTFSIGITNISVVHYLGTTQLLQNNESYEAAELATIKWFIDTAKQIKS